jgi:hypothetical protein
MLLFKDFQKDHAEILPAPADADSPAPHATFRELLSENIKLYCMQNANFNGNCKIFENRKKV